MTKTSHDKWFQTYTSVFIFRTIANLFYRSHDSFHVHMRNQICTEWAWGNRSWCSFTKFDTQKYTFPPLIGGTLNHGKLQWKSLRWRLGKSIRRKLLWPKDLPLSWLTNSSGFLRSSDQARLKISLVYFRILQWPYTPVMRLLELKILVPLQNKILHKQAVLQRFFICLFLFPVCRSFVPPVIINWS